MANFSRDPLDVLQENQQKGYVGLYLEQGVPFLDRDFNLLQDLITATVRSLIQRYIGDGVAAAQPGFQVTAIPANNDFQIGAGTALVAGLEVSLSAPLNYRDQTGVPNLRTPSASQPNPREDIVYLEVWLEEVDGAADADLLNSNDVGMQTSVRQRPTWQVLVAENGLPPAPAPGRVHLHLARLTRPRSQAQIDDAVITDLRQPLDNLGGLAARLDLIERLLIRPSFTTVLENQVQPDTSVTGGPVTLTGVNFGLQPVQVLFGTHEAVVNSATDTQIVAVVPGTLPDSTAVRVTVRTAGGETISDDEFTRLP